jgi:hypothetical protein
MAETLPGWSPEVERSFKEVLYRFLEEVHCTKAALYLLTPAGSFALAAQYGFGRRDSLAAEHARDDVLSRAAYDLTDEPLVVNQPEDRPELAEYLGKAGSTRLLVYPMHDAGRVVGFVDARDKGGQQPFEAADLTGAASIAAELLELVRGRGVSPELETAVGPEEIGTVEGRPVSLPTRSDPALLDDAGMAHLTEEVVETVIREGVCAVGLTVADGGSAATVIYTGLEPDDTSSAAIVDHQSAALREAGAATPDTSSWRVEMLRVAAADDDLLSSVVATGVPLRVGAWSIVLSVVGAEGSADPAWVLERLHRVVARAHEMTSLRFCKRSLARRLLQPGEKEYPDLNAHSIAVSQLCWRMARALGYDHQRAEDAAVVGLLHDVGMRELDYDRLYRHPAPEQDDRRIYRQHVLVGERILNGIGMDGIAAAVRHHHERWDGKGYPDRLEGEEIPLLARLVHVAEVFDVLTSSSSYRPPVSVVRALQIMESVVREQFDPGMMRVLTQIVK